MGVPELVCSMELELHFEARYKMASVGDGLVFLFQTTGNIFALDYMQLTDLGGVGSRAIGQAGRYLLAERESTKIHFHYGSASVHNHALTLLKRARNKSIRRRPSYCECQKPCEFLGTKMKMLLYPARYVDLVSKANYESRE
jgi:hypothetical protein